MPLDHDRDRQFVMDPVGHVDGVLQFADVLQQDGKFVTSEPCNRVPRSDTFDQFESHLNQKSVPDEVAKAVIDEFEAVQIKKKDGIERLAAACGGGDNLLESISEQG